MLLQHQKNLDKSENVDFKLFMGRLKKARDVGKKYVSINPNKKLIGIKLDTYGVKLNQDTYRKATIEKDYMGILKNTH